MLERHTIWTLFECTTNVIWMFYGWSSWRLHRRTIWTLFECFMNVRKTNTVWMYNERIYNERYLNVLRISIMKVRYVQFECCLYIQWTLFERSSWVLERRTIVINVRKKYNLNVWMLFECFMDERHER